ncbi:MAG: Do family serine endopeptidase [Opitutaceae bacterium]|nr:Do family serine endopeptidase [Opitutaceae bacterium]
MKFKALTCLFAATLAALLLTGAKEAPPKPVLKVDASPVGVGKAGAVASYADVIEPVQQAVVSVYSAKIVRQHLPPYFRQFFGDQERETREEGLGSGVIVSADGYILTNNHVIEGADQLNVALPDNREFKARVIGADPKTDVAIIKIEAENLPVVTLADSDKLRVGDVVFAIGNPLNVGQTVTMGIVSALGRKNLGLLDEVAGYEDFIQTDAPINMGNSGGALVDAGGRLVGINSAIMSTTNGSMGIGFAVPVNLAASIMHSLVETGTVARGFLGVGVQVLTPDLAEGLNVKESKGVVINSLTPDGPAAKAGLKLEDVILAINDKPVDSLQTLRLIVAQTPPGTKVRVKSVRDGKTAETEVTLSRLTDDGARPDELVAGVSVTRVTDELRRTYRLPDDVDGLIVTEVAEDSAFRERFRAGMVIVQVDRIPVEEVAAARALVRPGRHFCLVWDRGGYRFVPFQVP